MFVIKTLDLVIKNFTYAVNNIDPYIPEWWSNETLAILEEEMVAAPLVNRDFEQYFNQFGDTVNTRRPREFEGVRKVKNEAVTTQDAVADNIQVLLDQWNHVSFTIDDAENTMSMKLLIDEFARPAATALARMVDRTVLGQYPRFLPNMAGNLNGVTTSNIKDYIIDLRKKMDDDKAPAAGRNLILTSKTEGDALRPEWFTSADKVGDNGTALQRATLGTKLGLNFYKDLNMADVAVGNTIRTFQINLSGGYAVGSTSLVVDTGTGEITPGTWINIGGMPYQVASRTGTAPTTAIVLSYGLKRAAANDDPILVYTPGAVNLVAGYAAGWTKAIVIDGFTVAPQVGQLVSFAADVTNTYTIIAASLTSITLDRALVVALVNDDTVNIGPAGAYNLCITRNAITLAIRPLRPTPDNIGVKSATISHNGLSMRTTIAYDATYQRTRWTLDFLAGIQVLDKNLGAVLLG